MHVYCMHIHYRNHCVAIVVCVMDLRIKTQKLVMVTVV